MRRIMKTISDNTETTVDNADAFVVTIQLQWTCQFERGRMANDTRFAEAVEAAYKLTMKDLTELAPAMFENELARCMGKLPS
jgi:hypothetical protein